MPLTTAEPVVDLPVRDYNRAVRRVALLLVVGGVVARLVRYLANGPLWLDEAAVALNLADRPFAGLHLPLDHNQIAPVLFLWAERLVMNLFGDGERALRLVPLLLGV